MLGQSGGKGMSRRVQFRMGREAARVSLLQHLLIKEHIHEW
jgi:hypothetical protein